jgi:hypothetical protein
VKHEERQDERSLIAALRTVKPVVNAVPAAALK